MFQPERILVNIGIMHLNGCFVMSSKNNRQKHASFPPDRHICIDMNMYLRSGKRSRPKSTKRGGKRSEQIKQGSAENHFSIPEYYNPSRLSFSSF